MISLRLSEIAGPLHGQLQGADAGFRGLSTDSRTLEPGQLFVALVGPRFDGHGFIDAALQRGAAAALVEQPTDLPLPSLRVADTRLALGRLSRLWRGRFSLPLVAVTGSNGKTTVKEMLAAILGRRGPVLATRGNLNNDIGVPLTLAGLGEEHLFAVIEMGANHAGEIAALCALARPSVGVVTQCAPAHLEGFGSIEGVARAKGEIFQTLPADGTAVINFDDPYAGLWRDLAGQRRILGFGFDPGAVVRAADAVLDEVSGHAAFRLITPAGEAAVQLRLVGQHNVMNALAAAACCHALGLEPADIAAGLAAVEPVRGRLQLQAGPGGSRLVDDTYNANPGSLNAALDLLAGLPGEHWLALGDMGELGPDAERLHRDAVRAARAAGVTRLYALGPLAGAAAEEFGPGARRFDDRQVLARTLKADLHAGVVVLLKASRSMRLDEVVATLVGGAEEAGCC